MEIAAAECEVTDCNDFNEIVHSFTVSSSLNASTHVRLVKSGSSLHTSTGFEFAEA